MELIVFILFLNIFTMCFGFAMDYFEDFSQASEDSYPTTNYFVNTRSRVSQKKINIHLYYESFCPFSVIFYIDELYPSVFKIGKYLNVKLYPYGNAKTIENNGHYEFNCQHGPKECYGNMLHACAIEDMGDNVAFGFIYCLMLHESNDEFADTCGNLMSIDVEKTKQCAKGKKGIELLKKYGDESKTVGFTHVPYVLIDGKHLKWNGKNFMANVCAAFKQPPDACQ